MSNKSATLDDVIQSIRELTRVVLLTLPESQSRAEIIRKLYEMNIAQADIARILGIETKKVTSVVSAARKKAEKGESADE